MPHYVLMGYGQDAQGIVAQYATILKSNGANVRSSMARAIGGQAFVFIRFDCGIQGIGDIGEDIINSNILRAFGFDENTKTLEIDSLQEDNPRFVQITADNGPGLVEACCQIFNELEVSIMSHRGMPVRDNPGANEYIQYYVVDIHGQRNWPVRRMTIEESIEARGFTNVRVNFPERLELMTDWFSESGEYGLEDLSGDPPGSKL